MGSNFNAIDQLPNEVLTRILAELDQASLCRCARVSRRWHALATQPILWRRVRICRQQVVREGDLTCQLSAWLCGALQELHACKVPVADLATLLISCPNLHSFTVEWLVASPADVNLLALLGRCCHRLRRLQLIYSDSLLTKDSLMQLRAGCAQLSRLDLVTRFVDIKSLPVKPLAGLIGPLDSLSLSSLHPLPSLLQHLKAFPNLTVLSLSCVDEQSLRIFLYRSPQLCELTLLNTSVDDQLAKQLAAAGGRLRTLRLHTCENLSTRALCALLNSCPHLLRLHLSDCRTLTGKGLRQAAVCLPPGLEDLQLTGIGADRVSGIDLAEPLPQSLRRLELTGLQIGGYDALGLRTGLSGCSELTHLTLEACHDDLLAFLLAQLPCLRCLCLADCSQLTRRAWAKLRSLPASSTDLHEFLAEHCTSLSLTDEAVADLCASPVARGLRRLRLHLCSRLTDAALVSIASSCPHLSELHLLGFNEAAGAGPGILESAYENALLFNTK